MSKKLIGMDQRTKKWGDDIFGAGFEAGAKARVAAGIPAPTGIKPRRTPKIPPEYVGRYAKSTWASGWRGGYAIGVPNSRAADVRSRRRALAWKQALAQRGTLRLTSADLTGHWRTTRGESSKLLTLDTSGAMTGKVVKGKAITEHVRGTWALDDDCLVLDFASNASGGEKGALYKTRSVIMSLAANRFVIATSETMRERYTRSR